MKTRVMMGAIAVAMVAGGSIANANVYQWDKVIAPGETNNAAGIFERVQASFDSVSNQFSWTVTFSNQVTRGYTLAVSPGPNPKGHAGELALLYFDGFASGGPKVTAYAYNGLNLNNSWQDGNGLVAGNQTPDIIHNANDGSWYTASVTDTPAGKRIMTLTADATVIQNHIPLHPGPGGPSEWTGLAFGPSAIGVWMHTYTGLSAGYLDNGALCGWDYNQQGWFDGQNFTGLTVVPLPTPVWMGLAGLAGAAVVVRRRKAAQA